MIRFAEQRFLFIHTPKKQGALQSSYVLSQLSVLFSILTSARFTEASTDSKTQLSMILLWQKQKEGSSACSNTSLGGICSL